MQTKWCAGVKRGLFGSVGLFLAVGVVALAAGLAAGGSREAHATAGTVCGRTSEVSAAIVAASGVASCSQVTDLHLRDVTELDLSGQSISSLSADDFDGMHRLQILDLSDNALTSLPSGVFDELYLLKTLRLNNNQLTTLPADLFDEVLLLEELDLSGNPSLTLPEGMFDDFDRFSGIGPDGEPVAAGGSHPVMERFLQRHGITSPEEFIEALPDLHKERFVMVYQSEAAAKDHVSATHPRVISFGGDGRFTFAWNTDPDAPSKFRDVVEFLRQNDTDWSAGIIDFSGETPRFVEPAACQTCHGSVNKPLWGTWGSYGGTPGWKGTEFALGYGATTQEEYEGVVTANRAVLQSTDPRIEPLDFSMSTFLIGTDQDIFATDYGVRHHKAPDGSAGTMAVEEAGVIWSLRHGEVLHRRLKASEEDYRRHAEKVMCAKGAGNEFRSPETLNEAAVYSKFPESVHKLDTLTTPDARLIQAGENLADVHLIYHTSVYGRGADSVTLLAAVDLWQTESVVRKLFRETSNAEGPRRSLRSRPGFNYFAPGSATIEDELIQKLRLHFGRGTRAALDERDRWNAPELLTNSAGFVEGLLGNMAPRVCAALRYSKPRNLVAEMSGGHVLLDWDAPGWETGSVTGYRIMRGADAGSLQVLVDDTGTTASVWIDGGPAPGDYVYAVQAIYDGYYPSPQSGRARQTVTEQDDGPLPPIGLEGAATDWSVELSWSVPVQPAGVYLDGMVLERLDAGGVVVWSEEVYDDDPAGDDWQHTVWYLDAATGYRFRVKLLVDGEDPAYSQVLAVTTEADPPVGPSGLSAVAAADSVALSWEIPAQPGWLADGGSVQVVRQMLSPLTEREWPVSGQMVWQRGKTSWQFTDTAVKPAYTYRYRIRTYFGGRFQYSDHVEVTTPNRAVDPDADREGATVLDVTAATLGTWYYDRDSLDRAGGDAVDYFTFTADAGYLALGVHDRLIDIDVYLEDADAEVVAQSSPKPSDDTVEWIETAIDAGIYYIRVQAAADGPTGYYIGMRLTAGPPEPQPPQPEPSAGPLRGFTLLDASDQSVLATLTDGTSVALADPNGGSYAIRADYDPTVAIRSVIFELSGPGVDLTKTENLRPYSLHGDYSDNRIRKLHGDALPAGSYTLRATAYSQRRGNGEVLGTLEVSFTVTNA